MKPWHINRQGNGKCSCLKRPIDYIILTEDWLIQGDNMISERVEYIALLNSYGREKWKRWRWRPPDPEGRRTGEGIPAGQKGKKEEMISKKMQETVQNSSMIRAMFEDGKKMKELYGAENVYDFSLGNPNTPPPQEINRIILDILQNEKPTLVHGYMNNAGYEDVRSASRIPHKKFKPLRVQNIQMTTGWRGLNVILKTLLDPEDEVIVFAPYFSEYRAYAENYGGKLVVVPPDTADFQPNLEKFKEKITNRTKAVIVNSPNNPTGVVYSEATITKLAEILRKAQNEFHTDIYLIADEPYRELVYDGVFVPYIPRYYENTIVAYSYSSSVFTRGADRLSGDSRRSCRI